MDDDKIDVLIADDHAGVRSAIAALIARTPGLRVVASVSSGAAAIDDVARLQPAVVIMDLGMPGIDGVEATGTICTGKSAPAVVAFSGSRELWREAGLLERHTRSSRTRTRGRSWRRSAGGAPPGRLVVAAFEFILRFATTTTTRRRPRGPRHRPAAADPAAAGWRPGG